MRPIWRRMAYSLAAIKRREAAAQARSTPHCGSAHLASIERSPGGLSHTAGEPQRRTPPDLPPVATRSGTLALHPPAPARRLRAISNSRQGQKRRPQSIVRRRISWGCLDGFAEYLGHGRSGLRGGHDSPRPAAACHQQNGTRPGHSHPTGRLVWAVAGSSSASLSRTSADMLVIDDPLYSLLTLNRNYELGLSQW